MRWVWWQRRGNDYGVEWSQTWPHASLGVSAHVGRFGHVSLHLPVGVLVVGCIGARDVACRVSAKEEE